MATMRRRENLTMPDVYSRSQSMSLPQGYSSSKAPVFRRNCSVATSAPSFHEPTMLTTPTQINWMLHQTTSQTPTSTKNCYYSNYEKQSSNKTSFWKIFPALILIFVPWIPCQLTKSELHKRKTEIKGLIAEQKEFVQDLDRYTQTIKEFREGIDRLTKENELSFKELTTGVGKVDLQNEQYLEIEKAEETFVKRIDGLEKHIQIESQKKVTERFGDGPHRVKVTLEDNNGTFNTFVIELAMLIEMPHAVHHFLQMIDLQLWDGLALVHGTESDIIKATPLSLDTHQWAGQRFVDSNLTQMAFTEFSSTYPPPHHHKYSVAFEGRPGGPDFYISLEDDIDFHDHESAFGIVVEGRDVLDRFFLQRDHPDTPDKNRVQTMKIHSIRLLGEKNKL